VEHDTSLDETDTAPMTQDDLAAEARAKPLWWGCQRVTLATNAWMLMITGIVFSPLSIVGLFVGAWLTQQPLPTRPNDLLGAAFIGVLLLAATIPLLRYGRHYLGVLRQANAVRQAEISGSVILWTMYQPNWERSFYVAFIMQTADGATHLFRAGRKYLHLIAKPGARITVTYEPVVEYVKDIQPAP
jgi:hypothetical protein